MPVHNVESKEAFDEAIKSHSKVVVDCFATWCGPCKAIAPILAKLSNQEEFSDIYFVKIDVDELEDVSAELGISAMPTFFSFKDGEKSGNLVGAHPTKLTEFVQALKDA